MWKSLENWKRGQIKSYKWNKKIEWCNQRFANSNSRFEQKNQWLWDRFQEWKRGEIEGKKWVNKTE